MKALIISLKFNPGHVSHMVASYKQCEELGYECAYYIAPEFVDFLPKDSRFIVYGNNLPKDIDFALFLFPSEKVLPTIWKLRRYHECKIIYVFHEPVISFEEFSQSGYSRFQVFLEQLKDLVSCWIVRSVDAIVLPSQKAFQNFKLCKRYKNDKFYYVPLMFDNENLLAFKTERQYFSYIGTIASDHSYNEYLRFVLWAINNDELMQINFMIATKSHVERTETVQRAVSSGRLKIIDGHPLTNEEINLCYAESYMVWNAYERMMQSGVLPKAFMFGTPAIVLKKNESEFVKDGEGVVAINNNKSFEEIKNAILKVLSSFMQYSIACNELFLKNFYYKSHNKLFKNIIKQIQ